MARPSPAPSCRAASGMVSASPARSISRRLSRLASVKARAPYTPMSCTAIICRTVVGLQRAVDLVAVQEPGAQDVLHEEHRPEDDVRRKPQRADRLLDAPLVLEVRDAGGAVRRADRAVHEVLDARLFGERRDALPLFLLLLHSGFPGVLHREDAPGPGQRLLEGGGVVQVALNQGHALLLECQGGRALQLAGHAGQLEPASGQRVDDGAALLAGGAGDEDLPGCRHGAFLERVDAGVWYAGPVIPGNRQRVRPLATLAGRRPRLDE